jgi:hypothetical protein
MKTFAVRVPSNPLFNPCTLSDIRELEAFFGFKLPEDYSDFLLQHNGLRLPSYAAFPIAEPSDPDFDKGVITILCGLSDPNHQNDLRNWGYHDGYDFKDRVPDHVKVIGSSIIDKYITISLGPDDFGHVYIWNPVDWDEPQYYRKDYAHLQLCATSFSAWWDSIHYRTSLHDDDESDENQPNE